MPIELFIALAVLFGLVVGSFLNVVIHRLPVMMQRAWGHQVSLIQAESAGKPAPAAPDTYNLCVPRSACPKCGHPIGALENIPLLSYLWLRGQCAGCKTRISPRYPLIELLSGLLAGLVAWRFGWSLHAVAAFFLLACLVTLSCIDFDTQLLPDDITLPLLWAGLLFNLWGGFADVAAAVIGAAAGYLVLWLVYWAFKLTTGKEGMGYGDFKLLAALGAWFGWQLLPALLVLSSVAGALVGGSLILLAKHSRNTPIPFGPYLALGGALVLFFGPQHQPLDAGLKSVIGLTGGIGSGKSTVADMFSALGARIIDTDAISQQLTAPNGKAMALIADVFGPRFVAPTGCLDRFAMRQHVFNDAAAREKLEDILHPLIRTEVGLQLQQLSPAPYCMLVVPLLFESQAYQPLLQRVLVIDCPEALQIERAVARSRLDENTVRRIMAAQCSREQRLARADDVILNDQGLEKLQQRVAGLHAKYIALA